MRQWHCNPHPTQGWDLTARNVCNNCGGTSNEEEGFTSSAVFHEVGIGYRQTAVVSLNHLLGFRWQVQSKTAEKNQGSRKGSTTSGMLWQNPASGSGRCGSNVSHSDCHLPSLLTSNSAYQSPSPELQMLDSAQSISRYSKWAANLKEGLFLLVGLRAGRTGKRSKATPSNLRSTNLQQKNARRKWWKMHMSYICFAEYDFCFGCHPKKGKQQLLHICSACFLQACCMSPSGVKSSLSSLFTTWER